MCFVCFCITHTPTPAKKLLTAETFRSERTVFVAVLAGGMSAHALSRRSLVTTNSGVFNPRPASIHLASGNAALQDGLCCCSWCCSCPTIRVRLTCRQQVRQVCRQIVSDYETRAKLWMSPAQNAERFLRPLVTEFACWLRANRDVLYQASATEGLLRSIDEDLRNSLKTQVQLCLLRLRSLLATC